VVGASGAIWGTVPQNVDPVRALIPVPLRDIVIVVVGASAGAKTDYFAALEVSLDHHPNVDDVAVSVGGHEHNITHLDGEELLRVAPMVLVEAFEGVPVRHEAPTARSQQVARIGPPDTHKSFFEALVAVVEVFLRKYWRFTRDISGVPGIVVSRLPINTNEPGVHRASPAVWPT